MEDDMGREDTPTEFAEGVHEGLIHKDRGESGRAWDALLRQMRHDEHLRSAQEFHTTGLAGLFYGLSRGRLRGWLEGFLGASTMQLCLADSGLPADSSTKPIVRHPSALMRKAFNRGRDTLPGPRRLALPDGSLEKALGEIWDDFSSTSRSRMRLCMVILGESRLLMPELQEQIYWIAREALLNALRHSAASRIEVEIEYLARKLRVVVRDDGAGIDPESLQTRRHRRRGLASIQERAASIGAKVRVWSKCAEGTEVEIELPIPRKTA
jgi:signal transduction histidine kinase